MSYVELSSAKYMASVTQEEAKLVRHGRNQKAIRDFTTFLLGLVAMQVGVFAVQHMHLWRPHVEHLLSTIGLA